MKTLTDHQRTTTIVTLLGQHARVTLPAPHYTDTPRGEGTLGPGVWITALYASPRSGRRFGETYSIWETRPGTCIGTRTLELTTEEYLSYCDCVGVDPVGVTAQDVR